MRRALICILPLLTVACPKSQQAVAPSYAGPPQVFKLLSATSEAETAARLEKRVDLFVTTDSGDPVPSVVAIGEVGPFSTRGGRVRLYGDPAGKLGWSIDNFLLLEISAGGKPPQRVAIGFQQGITLGSERIDSVGPMRFSFEPGEVELSSVLPSNEPITITATALDVGGIGLVSDVYLVVSYDGPAAPSNDDLRDDQ